MTLFSFHQVDFKNIIRYPDMEISEGGATFICGESGSGKSTLLKLLNGVISPAGGTIFYSGKNIEEYNPIALRREVLLASQSVYLFDATIKDNFNKYYTYLDLKPLPEEAMESFLDICSVHLPLDSSCSIMSGGERQRVFIAINLSLPSKVLLLDEPTSTLDHKNAHLLIKNIKSFCRQAEKTLLVVSHDRAIADQYADHIIDLTGGSV